MFCARPSGITGPDAGFLKSSAGRMLAFITSDQLAKAMIKVAVDGYPKNRLIENDVLLTLR